MTKITFMGAGSTVFAKNILGDCFCCDSLSSADIALYDIDATRLAESQRMVEVLNRNLNQGRAVVKSYLGTDNRRAALAGADFVINAIQVGGYKPATVIDFEIPKKYGLRQTIADTLGIGGIFRALRTIPVMWDFAWDMEAVCPEAWFLNYSNPMCMLTGAMLRHTEIKTVGLCHSVQSCSELLLKLFDLPYDKNRIRDHIAGINHMSWLLEIRQDGVDLYPQLKKLAAEKLALWRNAAPADKGNDMVRLSMMLNFGYYVTESSEHNAEYQPYWIKSRYPELLEEFNIPLDEYPRRCIHQIEEWKKRSQELVDNPHLTHQRSHEYGSKIIEAMVTNRPVQIGGNVINRGFIPNLPSDAVVEIPCLVDGNGVQGCYVGNLPIQCAALNQTNINVQLLTIEAAATRKKDYIYQAAMLDPHTSAELNIDDIKAMCDDLIEAHGTMLPGYN